MASMRVYVCRPAHSPSASPVGVLTAVFIETTMSSSSTRSSRYVSPYTALHPSPRAIADVGLVEGEPGLVAVDPAYGDDHTHQGELPDGGEFGAGCDGVTVPPGCQSGREGGREGRTRRGREEGREGERGGQRG